MAKLQVIHYASNSDLPASVQAAIPDAVGQTLFRSALNAHMALGANEMNAYQKAYKLLAESGYAKGDDGVWIYGQEWTDGQGGIWTDNSYADALVGKSTPTSQQVHVNRPLGSDDEKQKDDPGTQDVDVPKVVYYTDDPTIWNKFDGRVNWVSGLRFKKIEKNDTINLDVPLFLKLLETAREDVHADSGIHSIVDAAIELMESEQVLTMENYNELVDGINSTLDKYDVPGQSSDVEMEYTNITAAPDWGRGFPEFLVKPQGMMKEDDPGTQFVDPPDEIAAAPNDADSTIAPNELLAPTDNWDITKAIMYHGTPKSNIDSIMESGLEPRIGENTTEHHEDKIHGNRIPKVHLFSNRSDAKDYGTVLAVNMDHESMAEHELQKDPEADDAFYTSKAIPPEAIKVVKINISKRISGSSQIKLNAAGKALANKLGQRIAAKGGLDVGYCSDLNRGIQTLDAIATACPHMTLAKPTAALEPWKLGAFEGLDGQSDNIIHYIEHPDERPAGTGRDGADAETFHEGAQRQLDFWKKIYEDFEADPTIKIGVVCHGRGMDLLQAAVDAGFPEDGHDTVDEKDLIEPDEVPHAAMLRWHKDEIQEIDLDDDDLLKPGIYPILHSLTDDDKDDGNEQLEKGGPGSGPHAGGGHLAPFGNHVNRKVEVDKPGHAMHGQTGTIIRQLGNESAVDFKGDNAEWIPTEHLIGKVAKQIFLPPTEVLVAAKSAYDLGTTIIDITSNLAEGTGLDAAGVQSIAKHFESFDTAGESEISRNAWGGELAGKWAQRVLKKIEKDFQQQYPPWVGVDLDNTLAEQLPHEDSFDGTKIGPPMPKMLAKVKQLLKDGKAVRIFTARIAHDPEGKVRDAIEKYCIEHIGQKLPVTNEKDPGMTELIDDKVTNADEINKAGHSNGVMISFWINPEIAKTLAIKDGEVPEDMHVTLVYLGKLQNLSMDKIGKLETKLASFAATFAPIKGDIAGPIRFAACENTEGRDVAVASFDSPSIQDFRKQLLNMVEGCGIEVGKNFSYTPHITLKFISTSDAMPVQRIAPIPVTFDKITFSIGGAQKVYDLAGTKIAKVSGSHEGSWVTINGNRVLIGSDGQPLAGNPKAFGRAVSDKVERARASAVLTGTTEQKIADDAEAKLSRAIGIPRTKNNSAFDLKNDEVGVEVKCLITGHNEKLTMSKTALARKIGEQRDEGLRGFTVAVDMRGGRQTAAYYYKVGFGSFRLGSMTKVSLSELKSITGKVA